MKKFLSFTLLLTILLSSLSFSSCYIYVHEYQGKEPKFKLNNDHASYTLSYMYLDKEGEVVIPSEYNGLPVTRIGSFVFWNEDYLKSLVIPDTITHINRHAFQNCVNLEIVSFEEGSKLEVIEGCAFGDCHSLKEIELPVSLKSLVDQTFLGCYSLESIHIPKNVSHLNGHAFTGCDSLINITVDEENETFKKVGNFIYEIKDGKKYISMCLAGDENGVLSFPENIDGIRSSAFSVCKNIDTVYIHAGFDYIPDILCAKEYIVDEDNPNFCSIGGVVYSKDMTKLVYYPRSKEDKTFTVPSSVEWIASSGSNPAAFANVKYLENVIISEGVTLIDWWAFSGSSINTLELPKSLESIGSKAFYECNSLEEIKYAGTRDEFRTITKGHYWIYFTKTPIIKVVCTNGARLVWTGLNR